MGKFRFWATIVLAVFLTLFGIFIAQVIPLPRPITQNQTKVIYALAGFLIGMLSYARLAAWAVQTANRLSKLLIKWLVFEVSRQITAGLTMARQMPNFLHPEPQIKKAIYLKSLILDTSSLIDGRILDVASSGFLNGVMVIPDFVLRELQHIADSADTLKRNRGRRGFDIVNGLKKIKDLQIHIFNEANPKIGSFSQDKELVKRLNGKSVDDKLVDLAKFFAGKIITCDYNLNRFASSQGVRALNINELANSLKFLPIPGEKIKVKLIHDGKDKNQGVGYLIDGTMVVVKDGLDNIGNELEVEVTKILQNPAGRMIFAKVN